MTLQNIKSSAKVSSSKGFLVIHTSYSPYATFGAKWLRKSADNHVFSINIHRKDAYRIINGN